MIVDYDEDFHRYSAFLEGRFQDLETTSDEEFFSAFEEYQELFPMDLVVYETRFEMIFYNRPIGEFEHYWKTPGYGYIWKKGDFFALAKENLKNFLNRLPIRN